MIHKYIKLLFVIFSLVKFISVDAQVKYHKISNLPFPDKTVSVGTIKRCPFNDTIIYVGGFEDYSHGYLAVVGIKQLRKPSLLKFFYGDKDDSLSVKDIFFKDKTMYTIGKYGIHIFDISNPALPVLKNRIRTVKKGTSTIKPFGDATLAVIGNNLYIGGFNFYSIDISDVNNATYKDELGYAGINSGTIQVINNNTLVAGDGYDILKIDVSNPSDIKKKSLIKGGDSYGQVYNPSTGVLYGIKGEFIGTKTALIAKNVVTEARLDSVHISEITTVGSSAMNQPIFKNDTLYVNRGDDIFVFDVKNINNIKYLYNIIGLPIMYGDYKLADGNLVFIAEETKGFSIYSISSSTGLNVTSVDDEILSEMENKINIYPNPSNGEFYVVVNISHVFPIQYSIFYLSGEILKTGLLNEKENKIHFQSSKGLYLMRFGDKSYKIFIE